MTIERVTALLSAAFPTASILIKHFASICAWCGAPGRNPCSVFCERLRADFQRAMERAE